MLAGTVLTNKTLAEIQQLLGDNDLPSSITNDELKLSGKARILFREGFEHELILVGDARNRSDLMQSIETVSRVLCQHRIEHAFEVYDRDNQLIAEHTYQD